MGTCPSKNRAAADDIFECEKDLTCSLIQKIRLLQEEINVILQQRDEEAAAYEKQLMSFMFREAHWKEQKKKLIQKVSKLKRRLRKIKRRYGIRSCPEADQLVEVEELVVQEEVMHEKQELYAATPETAPNEANTMQVEEMGVKTATRDETAHKWKMLYLAIKSELDHLIQMTHQGVRLYLQEKEEEGLMEELQRELKNKDEIIRALNTQVMSAEQEAYEKRREIDILKQSLKITSNRPQHEKNKLRLAY